MYSYHLTAMQELSISKILQDLFYSQELLKCLKAIAVQNQKRPCNIVDKTTGIDHCPMTRASFFFRRTVGSKNDGSFSTIIQSSFFLIRLYVRRIRGLNVFLGPPFMEKNPSHRHTLPHILPRIHLTNQWILMKFIAQVNSFVIQIPKMSLPLCTSEVDQMLIRC